jgi:short-subunit dehydrogenase
MGVPDVVVANAGQGLDARVVVTSDEAIHRILEINVVGVYRTLRPFIPAMIERGSGRLLMISSVVGKRGIPHLSAYCASKFALHGLADSLRAEMHGTGVSVGVVCPSTTDSEFSERLLRSGPSQRPVRITRHSAESVARAILRMARSRRPEMVLSAEGKFMVLVDTFAPRLVDFFLAKALNRPR